MRDSCVGIDIEQFLRDPYATGIQRVLQYLAKEWPAAIHAAFVVPMPDVDDSFVLLEPFEAAELLSLPFGSSGDRSHLKNTVDQWITEHASSVLSSRQLHNVFDIWFLPEVSYLPSVVSRFEDFRTHARTAMIGYDVLPMSEPANYRFPPGYAAWVSEYFRLLATADVVVCISEYSLRGISERLRRSVTKTTVVCHPGGDHIPIRSGLPPVRPVFTRVGTMEFRKMPVEILEAFLRAVDEGLDAELVYVGIPSASDQSINARIAAAIDSDYPVRWIQKASDSEVYDIIQGSTAFLSFGIEGYGIPVLEAIRLGAPVIYGGVQPAAALMDGYGAIRASQATPHPAMFGMDIPALRLALNPARVPTWSTFVEQVAQLVSGRTVSEE